MRFAAPLAAALLAAAPAALAGVVILRDGRAIRTHDVPRRSGPVVVFELEDGTAVSVREERVDWAATGRAAGLLGAARAGSVSPPRATGPERGPSELDSLGEERLLGALVHTGRRRERGPGEDLAPAPARDERAGPRPDPAPGPAPLIAVGVSPFTGELASAVEPGARRRLAPLAEPAAAAPEPADRFIGPPRLEGTRGPAPAESFRPAPAFGLVSPRDGEAVLGVVRLEARARPGGAPLVRVEYRVDGQPVGTAVAEPWQVEWRAPGDRQRHLVEARLERADGAVEVARARVLDVYPDAEVDVELVPLSVSVTNHEYLFVRELEASDFLVFEDGVRQDISHFSRDPVPLAVLVAVDTSWSMNGRKLELAAEAVRRLAARLGPDDRLAVGGFAERFRLLAPFGPPPAAASALEGLAADGGTAMLDAESEAIELLAGEEGRRILLLVGDGEDYVSKTRIETVVATAQRAAVTVFAVGVLTWRLRDGMPEHWADDLIGRGRPAYWTDSLRVRGLKLLRRQTDATGGVLYLPKFAGELPYVFEHLVAELKSAYQLGYYPKNRAKDGRFRSIQVAVDGRQLVARTRRGYFAPSGPEISASAPASGPDARAR